MKYLSPKCAAKVNWVLSDQTRAIVEYYAKYSGYSEDEIVDFALKNLLGDPRFANYLRAQRRTKRLVDRVFYGDETMRILDDYIDLNADSFGETATTDDNAITDKAPLDDPLKMKEFQRGPDRC